MTLVTRRADVHRISHILTSKQNFILQALKIMFEKNMYVFHLTINISSVSYATQYQSKTENLNLMIPLKGNKPSAILIALYRYIVGIV